MNDDPIMAALARLEAGQAELRTDMGRIDAELSTFRQDVSAALGTVNTVLGEIIGGMATTAQLDTRFDALMKRMNDQFERVLLSQHVLQVNDDTLTQRVTRLEQDVRQLRGGGA